MMDDPTLQVELAVKTPTRDPYDLEGAGHDLWNDIQRLAAERSGQVVERKNIQRGSVWVILLDIAPAVITGLCNVVSAYTTRHQTVTIEINVKTPDGTPFNEQVAANMTPAELEKRITAALDGLDKQAAEPPKPSAAEDQL